MNTFSYVPGSYTSCQFLGRANFSNIIFLDFKYPFFGRLIPFFHRCSQNFVHSWYTFDLLGQP